MDYLGTKAEIIAVCADRVMGRRRLRADPVNNSFLQKTSCSGVIHDLHVFLATISSQFATVMKPQALLFTAILAPAILSAAPRDVIKPQRDMTIIKSTGGDITMLHALIDVNGPHNIELYSFFKRTASGPATQVPFERGGNYEATLAVRHGADCAMTGVRVLQGARQPRVVYAVRKGDWSDEKPFTYTIYELVSNGGEMPATPSLYFAEKKKVVSKLAFCDAEEALDKEAQLYQGALN